MEKTLTSGLEDEDGMDELHGGESLTAEDENGAHDQRATTLTESAVGGTHKPKTVTSARDGLDESVTASEVTGSSLPKKKKRKKKAAKIQRYLDEESFPTHTILQDVAHLHDDVVEVDNFIPSATTNVWHTNVLSPPTGKLFVESRGAFKAMDKQKLMEASNASLPIEHIDKNTPSAVKYGLGLYSTIKRVATYCHGLLAGFALWLCVMVYCLGPPYFPLSDFIVHYSPLASTVQALFYLMTTICIVSLMGSINVGGEDNIFEQIRNVPSGLVALIFYFVTLLLSLSIADQDDMLSLYAHNSTLSGGDERETNFQTWRNVNLCRCLGAILAWLFLAFFPHQDLLKTYLQTFTTEVARN